VRLKFSGVIWLSGNTKIIPMTLYLSFM
jgi:hypothetical protein